MSPSGVADPEVRAHGAGLVKTTGQHLNAGALACQAEHSSLVVLAFGVGFDQEEVPRNGPVCLRRSSRTRRPLGRQELTTRHRPAPRTP